MLERSEGKYFDRGEEKMWAESGFGRCFLNLTLQEAKEREERDIKEENEQIEKD